MKKVTLFVASLFIAHGMEAQVMSYRAPFINIGVKVGGNVEHLSGSSLQGGPGFVAGIFVEKNVSKVGLRLEVTASSAQYPTKYPAANYVIHTPGMDTVTKASFRVMYINVPLLFQYHPTEKFSLLLGPQFSYAASITDKYTEYTLLYGNADIIKKIDFSAVLGAEYCIGRKIDIGARIFKGIVDINNSTYYLVRKPWTSTGAQVSVSYRIM
jgi:hypothetical protein